MAAKFRAIEIAPSVFWVGAIDWSIADFHGYLTSRGSTYNAYLILDEKITLIDTVKAPFRDEMIARISSVVAPEEIDYIVSNHSEMDHSGALLDMIRMVKPTKVFASIKGKEALAEHFHLSDDVVCAVDDEQVISLGKMHLQFIETRMLHWPDSMFTFLPERKLLFSQDGFGMHLASSKIFVDENDADIVAYEFKKYYANIVMPFPSQVQKAMRRVLSLKPSVEIIASDHGPIFRNKEEIENALAKYGKWCVGEGKREKVVVVYDTMWNSTEKMAAAISDGLAESGMEVKIMPLRKSHRSDIATELIDAKGLLVGSPTLNNSIFPTVADVMCYLKGLRPMNLVGGSFGSFGWSGQAPAELGKKLEEMKIRVVSEPMRVKYVPSDKDISECREFGFGIARAIKED